MNITFQLPTTPKCKVVYVRDGTNYQGIIDTPQDNSALQVVMLKRQVGMSQIQRVEPVQPPAPLYRNHPAQHRIAKYSAISV